MNDIDTDLARLGFRCVGTFETPTQQKQLSVHELSAEEVIRTNACLARDEYEYIIRNHVPGDWIVGHEPI